MTSWQEERDAEEHGDKGQTDTDCGGHHPFPGSGAGGRRRAGTAFWIIGAGAHRDGGSRFLPAYYPFHISTKK
jgi:hypothetical protein